MAATLVQTSGKIRTSGSGDVTITMPSNFTAGNTAIASGCRYEGAITSLTLNSATATVATQSNSGISGVWIRYVASLTGGSNGGTLDTPGTSDYNTFSVEEWSGLDTAALVDSTATPATGNSSAPSVTVNPSATGNLIYGCWNSETGSSNLGISQPGSYTGAWTENDSNTYQGGSGAYRTAAATGSQAATWSTGLAVNWRAVGAVFKAASGGTSATVTGQTVTAAGSVISGAVAAGSSVAGQTITATSSVVAGTASAASSVAGQTLTASASLITGSASGEGNVSVSGQTVTATASVIAGTVSGASSVAGQNISASASLIAGTATADASATVTGQTLTATASLVDGSATGDPVAATGSPPPRRRRR